MFRTCYGEPMAKKKKVKLVRVRSGRPSKSSKPVMVRLSLALLDDLWATAQRGSFKDQTVWIELATDEVPLRALVRDALTSLVRSRISQNKRVCEDNGSTPPNVRVAAKSTPPAEIAAALKGD